MIAVADTGPMQYLIQTGAISSVPLLFQKLSLPQAVLEELLEDGAPEAVSSFYRALPPWLEIVPRSAPPDGRPRHRGEREAIQLAQSLTPDRLLIDDRGARNLARRLTDTKITGTLGILAELPTTQFLIYLTLLRGTSFYFSPSLELQIDQILLRLRE